MRALRILLGAWVGVLAVVMLVPALRAHLGMGFGALVSHDMAFVEPPPAPENSRDARADFAHALEKLTGTVEPITGKALTEPSTEPMEAYCSQHPDDAGAEAVLVRLILNNSGKQQVKDLKRAKLLVAVSQRGSQHEPNNWFWRMGTVVGLMALDQQQEARAELTRLPLPTHYHDYAMYQAATIDQLYSEQFWGVTGARRMAIYSSVAFPHLSAYREVRMRLFRSATPAEKDAWLSLGIALCRESDIFIGLLVGRVFVLSEVTNARMYNFKTEEKELAAMLVQMEKSRAGRSPSMSEIRGVATANISHLIDEDADPYYALLAYPLIAAAISLALVGLVAWTPWRMPTAHWSIPILVSFMGTLIFGASRFSLDRWLVYMGWESGNGIWRYVEVPCFLIWFVAVGHVIFQKWRVRRDFQGLVVVLLGAFLFGVSQSILPEAIAIPTVMALTALIGQKQEGGIHPWVSALQLTILMLLFQVAQQSSPPFLTVGIAAAALLSVSQPKTTTSWSLGFGLVLLFSGLAAGRWFDHRAMSWLEADQRRMAEFRAQLPK